VKTQHENYNCWYSSLEGSHVIAGLTEEEGEREERKEVLIESGEEPFIQINIGDLH
jgi:hypothetical protein